MNFFIDLDSEPSQGTPLAVKTLGLASASHSAVRVSHSFLWSLCSSASLQGLHNGGIPPPACLCMSRAILLPSNKPSMPSCSGAASGLPGHDIYLLLSLLQVAKELLQEICEQMGAGEQEEIQEFVLFAIRSDSDHLGK